MHDDDKQTKMRRNGEAYGTIFGMLHEARQNKTALKGDLIEDWKFLHFFQNKNDESIFDRDSGKSSNCENFKASFETT